MFEFIRKISAKKAIPISWTMLTIILLCIPGSVLPGLGLFGIKYLDKIAHIILFGGIVLLWSGYYSRGAVFQKEIFVSGTITLLSIGLGIALEYIQVNFIPNRSFDTGDILANAAGSIAVYLLFIFYKGKQKQR